jgi:hypothetical protein
MHRRRLAVLGLLALLLALLAAPATSLAYERRTLAGKYDVVVGWDTEPAYVNQRNAVGIRIAKSGTNPAEPVTGVDKTLKVQVQQGGQSRTFDLRPVFGQPGYYVADILPTRAGDYTWTFSGAIGTDPVDETFNTADGKVPSVAASSGLEFPIAAPDPDQVAVQLQASEAAADRAQTVAVIGVCLGLLGCMAAVLVWLTRPRAATGVLSSRDAAVRRAAGGGSIRPG